MEKAALFVDLPNLYSSLLREHPEKARQLRDYFLNWFDFDRLAFKLTGVFCDTWVYYSGRRFGPSGNRIEDNYLDEFIDRINSQRGVTARDVNIPGSQREPAYYECEECSHKGVAQWQSEKGIDSSLTVHFFETLDAWDTAFLISGDADFVPVVSSLRKRGKIVIGAGFTDASSALLRECYDYFDLNEIFFRDDFATYNLFSTDGLIHQWLNLDVKPISLPVDPSIDISVTFSFDEGSPNRTSMGYRPLSAEELDDEYPICRLRLFSEGPIQIEERISCIVDYSDAFPKYSIKKDLKRNIFTFLISPIAWVAAISRLQTFISRYPNLSITEQAHSRRYIMNFSYNEKTKKFEAISSKD